MWSRSGVSFQYTPFEVVRKETRECQFGPHLAHYFKKRDRTSSRIYLQGTWKLGCHAHIEICEYRLYPEYALSATEVKHLKSKKLRQLRETKLHSLKQALEEGRPINAAVVAQFIVQSESVECIAEALNVLREWNCNWNPPFFLSDFSEAEFSALKQSFYSTTVYGCDFHREQAWTRWVQDRKNGLDRSDADCLLDLLRACAWVPPGTDDCAVWKTNVHVQNWLTANWLRHPQVRPDKGISLLN